jgi:hypothetical protein
VPPQVLNHMSLACGLAAGVGGELSANSPLTTHHSTFTLTLTLTPVPTPAPAPAPAPTPSLTLTRQALRERAYRRRDRL